jgi:hypothetical protein
MGYLLLSGLEARVLEGERGVGGSTAATWSRVANRGL